MQLHPNVMDACKTLVEQAAVTGVEAALARRRAADSRSSLSRVEKVQGNTQRALDRALRLEVANKSPWYTLEDPMSF